MSVKSEYVPEGATAGLVPPADAPREVTQPLTDDAVAQQLERAAANEQTLKPLTFDNPRPAVVAEPPVGAAEAVSNSGRRIRQVKRTGAERPGVTAEGAIILTDAEPVPSVSDISAGAVDVPREDTGLGPILPHQRAGSNSDSPSRGVPRAVDDPGKRITGGFGDPADAQYYPLDGSELRELVCALMDQIHARLQDDLRFSMAVTYPRVRARVEVVVEGWPVDQTFQIPKVMAPHEKTPIEIARAHADECVFVVTAERVEMTADGESVSPPNAIRAELGLTAPRKQSVQTPTGRQLVDVVVP